MKLSTEMFVLYHISLRSSTQHVIVLSALLSISFIFVHVRHSVTTGYPFLEINGESEAKRIIVQLHNLKYFLSSMVMTRFFPTVPADECLIPSLHE